VRVPNSRLYAFFALFAVSMQVCSTFTAQTYCCGCTCSGGSCHNSGEFRYENMQTIDMRYTACTSALTTVACNGGLSPTACNFAANFSVLNGKQGTVWCLDGYATSAGATKQTVNCDDSCFDVAGSGSSGGNVTPQPCVGGRICCLFPALQTKSSVGLKSIMSYLIASTLAFS
jgi:hypothetical protein